MNFGQVLNLLINGAQVCRVGWNGKGMYLYLVKNWIVADDCLVASNYPHLPFIAIKTADNCVVPWFASQMDILANDWMLV